MIKFPDKALEQHTVFLGKTGSGKSYAMRGLVEQLLEDNQRVCIVDPKGDWWGLRSSADGKHAGFSIVTFGGEHGDVPLNQHVGGQVAELVGTGNRPCILDFGGWMVGERTRFWIDFASGLFKFNRGPLWLVIDEVHNFAPQGRIMDPDAGKCLHWTNRLASEGRGKGLRILMASQRPQKVHKDTLTCAETLVAMRVIHPRDRDAVKEWIDGCGDPKQGGEVLNSLAQMPRGEGWVWSPEIGFLHQLTFPRISTFDSFAAPTTDEKSTPKGWAEVDLDEVRSKLTRVVEEAKANDPALLKAEVRKLKAELAKGATTTTEIKEVQRPVFDDKDRKLISKAIAGFEMVDQTVKAKVEELRDIYRELNTLRGTIEVLIGRQKQIPSMRQPVKKTVNNNAIRMPLLSRQSESENGSSELGKPERRVLAVLAQYEDGCEIGKLALLSGYRISGGFRNILSALRTSGLISGENTGIMQITQEGFSHGPFEQLPERGQEFVQFWLSHPRLGNPEKRVLQVLIDNPEGLSLEELAEKSEYEVSGGFRNITSTLRTAGLIEGRNTERMKAADEFFP